MDLSAGRRTAFFCRERFLGRGSARSGRLSCSPMQYQFPRRCHAVRASASSDPCLSSSVRHTTRSWSHKLRTRCAPLDRLAVSLRVANDDSGSLDADDRLPRYFVMAARTDAESRAIARLADAECNYFEAIGGEFGSEIVARAEIGSGCGHDLATDQRRQSPHRSAPGIFSTNGRRRSSTFASP